MTPRSPISLRHTIMPAFDVSFSVVLYTLFFLLLTVFFVSYVRSVVARPPASSSSLTTATSSASALPDVEDLMKTSLIPKTLKRLKKKKQKPLSSSDKRNKRDALESSEIVPSFRSTVSAHRQTLRRRPARVE